MGSGYDWEGWCVNGKGIGCMKWQGVERVQVSESCDISRLVNGSSMAFGGMRGTRRAWNDDEVAVLALVSQRLRLDTK